MNRWLWFSIGLLLSPSLVAQCGGVERWQVKVGTDEGAPDVDLNPISTTIQELRALPSPGFRPEYRLNQEYNTYVIWATLWKYKRESGSTGDQDLHLVLVDEWGDTIIAEVPSSICVPGRYGDGSEVSYWQSYLVNARTQFEDRLYPYTTWREVNLSVQIIGVSFYDKPHNQTGHAPNYIELHPVLDIQFFD